MSSVAAPALVTGGALMGRDGTENRRRWRRSSKGPGKATGGRSQAHARTQERVVGVAWRLLGSREDARDAAQEVYLRVFRHLDRFRAEHDFRGWLYRITINVCRDAARRRRRAPVGNGTAPSRVGRAGRKRPCSARNGGSGCSKRSRRCPRKSARRSCLRDLEGLTSEQVARVLGSRPGTVRGQIASARMKMRSLCADLLKNGQGGLR